MANKLLIQAQDGTPKQISFADHAGDFSPTAANVIEIGTPTDVQMALASVTNTSYAQSAKFDFGENRADEYAVRIAIEIAATPTAGNALEFWIGYSPSATTGTGNPGGLSGSAGSYTGYSSNADASVRQLDYIGAAIVTSQATGNVQLIEVQGIVRPKERYGMLVIRNGSGASFHSDDVEINIVLDPIIPELQ